jgi:hypothetical protein
MKGRKKTRMTMSKVLDETIRMWPPIHNAEEIHRISLLCTAVLGRTQES